MTDYAVVLEEADDGGWWAHAPDLPGVISTADTPAGAEDRFREALTLYRDELRRDGRHLPKPRSRATIVSL